MGGHAAAGDIYFLISCILTLYLACSWHSCYVGHDLSARLEKRTPLGHQSFENSSSEFAIPLILVRLS